jgi:hypothetical protein
MKKVLPNKFSSFLLHFSPERRVLKVFLGKRRRKKIENDTRNVASIVSTVSCDVKIMEINFNNPFNSS